MTLIDSIVRSNISGEYRSAGGIYNSGGTLTLTRSAITGNSAPRSGGGIVNFGTVTLVNSTVSNSTASNNGGGIWSSRSLTLTNSTITGNAASNGGGIYNLAGTVSPLNSIIAGNAAPLRPDCRGVIASQGHNLIGDSSGCDFTAATGDLLGGSTNAIDPLLGPLQDNGGPTFTRALLSGSPSIDAGGDASCPATDQRGIPRPQGAHCDIGAFEFTGSVPPRAFDQTVTNVAATPLTIVLTASDPDTGDTLTFVIVSPPAGGDLFEGATATGGKITTDDPVLIGDTVTYKAGLGFAGTDTFEFKANDGTADGNVATVTIVVNEPIVKGAVVFEGMPNPISGARVTFSRDAAVQVLTSDPASGNFEMQLHPGIYAVTIEKDGFLKATKTGLVVNNDTVLTPARLLWGDADGNGIIDVKDVTVPAKNLGMKESPWE